MKTSWTKGVTGQCEKDIKASFLGSSVLRDRLKVMLEDKIEGSRTSAIKKDCYTSPSWPYIQADSIGYERALKEIISLLEK